MGIVLLLESRRRELRLFVVEIGPPLRINPVELLTDHPESRARVERIYSRKPQVGLEHISKLLSALDDATRDEHAPD
jgi:hypothetical protein